MYLVNSLRILVSEGIQLTLTLTIECTLLCIVVDTLKSHMIRGYMENFLVANFCRFYHTNRLYMRCIRDVITYDECMSR